MVVKTSVHVALVDSINRVGFLDNYVSDLIEVQSFLTFLAATPISSLSSFPDSTQDTEDKDKNDISEPDKIREVMV